MVRSRRDYYTQISILLFLLLTLLPLVAGILYALSYSLGLIGAVRTGFTWAHWQAVFASGEFAVSLGTSIVVATVSLTVSIVLALVGTIVIARQTTKATTFLIRHYYLPLSIPPIIAAFLTFQILGDSGLVSRLFCKIGWIANPESFPSLVNDYLYIGVIVTQVLMTFPFLTLLFLNYYKTTNLEGLVQMSKVLGAGQKQTYRRVVVPVLLQKARPNIVLFFIALMSSYEIPLLLGRQSPRMVSVLISQKFKKFNLADIPQAYAMTVLFAIFVIVLVAVFVPYKNTSD